MNEALRAFLQHMLPGCRWDISANWNPQLYPSSTTQFLSKAYWDMLDAKVTSREHWSPVSLDLSFGYLRHQPKPEDMVEFYDEIRNLTRVITLRIRQLFHNVDLWHNLAPHWLSMRHLSIEFRTPCPQIFFKHLSQMSRLEVLQLEFLVAPEGNRIKLDLTTSLTTLSLGLPLLIPLVDGFFLNQVELGVMTDLQKLILYAPTLAKKAQKERNKYHSCGLERVSPDWMYTLPQWTCLGRLEWHYISYSDFCALGPYLPTSLTDLVLTRFCDHREYDVDHDGKVYGHDPPSKQTSRTIRARSPEDDFPSKFDRDTMIGSLLRLPHLKTATLPKSLKLTTPPEDWFKWLPRTSFIKTPEFIWDYHGFPEMLPQMTSILELDLKSHKAPNPSAYSFLTDARISQEDFLDILSQMTQLTRLRMWSIDSFQDFSPNSALQRLKRLEWLSSLENLGDLDPLIWPDLKFVEIYWPVERYNSFSGNKEPQWPPVYHFLQRHTTLVELTLSVPFEITTEVHFWSVLSQLTLLTALKCTIDRGMDKTLTATELPPKLKRLIWHGCTLMIPYDHLVLEKVDLVADIRDTREDANDIKAFCQRNRVRNRTLEEWLVSLDTDSLTRHWFDD